MSVEECTDDIDIVIESIENKDYNDAITILKDIQEDLRILIELNK